MDIEEKINNEYQVSKINMSCDKVPTEIDDNILITRNGFGVLIGSAGSGKSNLVLYLLTHNAIKG
jgi:serine kinase of HPr protein (carbohydrate metabolism regulator)